MKSNKLNKGLYALAFGTLGFGITEYVMMGILPDIAADLAISIPQAGHLISVYALGVCIGAPLAVLVSRGRGLRTILVGLICIQLLGGIITTLAPNYYVALASRFISGLPHGAFFGVGSIVAERLADKNHSTTAVSIMVMGMTVANLLGVPLGTLLGETLSWRVIFAFSTLWSALTIFFIFRWIPVLPALPDKGVKAQFAFLAKPEPWLILAVTMAGNGGIFCYYSYVSPMMTGVAGFPGDAMTLIMVLCGGGMCLGNYLGGRLSDRYSPTRVILTTQLMMFSALVILYFVAGIKLPALLMTVLCCAGLFAVSSPQQHLIINHAPGGEMMGGAMIQIAFNLGNALGAYFGGLPIDSGAGVRYSALIGAAFILIGLFFAVLLLRRLEPSR
ncbi:MAG: MFS transporter [Candidatus Cryptobacteroides sp.]|nr:MFS transporter [Candidatus Cryptobacteroides sp.]